MSRLDTPTCLCLYLTLLSVVHLRVTSSTQQQDPDACQVPSWPSNSGGLVDDPLTPLRGKVVLVHMGMGYCRYCVEQAMGLEALKAGMAQRGMPDIEVLIVNGGVEVSRVNIHNFHNNVNLTVIQDTGEQVLQQEVLKMNKDDFIIFDRCGQKAYHIPHPYSNLAYRFTFRLLWLTYTRQHSCYCNRDYRSSSSNSGGEMMMADEPRRNYDDQMMGDQPQPPQKGVPPPRRHHAGLHEKFNKIRSKLSHRFNKHTGLLKKGGAVMYNRHPGSNKASNKGGLSKMSFRGHHGRRGRQQRPKIVYSGDDQVPPRKGQMGELGSKMQGRQGLGYKRMSGMNGGKGASRKMSRPQITWKDTKLAHHLGRKGAKHNRRGDHGKHSLGRQHKVGRRHNPDVMNSERNYIKHLYRSLAKRQRLPSQNVRQTNLHNMHRGKWANLHKTMGRNSASRGLTRQDIHNAMSNNPQRRFRYDSARFPNRSFP